MYDKEKLLFHVYRVCCRKQPGFRQADEAAQTFYYILYVSVKCGIMQASHKKGGNLYVPYSKAAGKAPVQTAV